jgi:hypothetical protein
LVPKLYVAVHAWHAALPMLTLQILPPCAMVTLTLDWTTLFMGDMGGSTVHEEESSCQTNRILKSGHWPHRGLETKTNCPTDRRSEYNLNLNLSDCTANCRPVLSSERAHYMKRKESTCNCYSKKCKIWSSAPRVPNTKTSWLSRNITLTLTWN